MTLSVKVSVGGNYVAEVKVNENEPINVGPNEMDRYIAVPHGRKSIIEIEERRATPEEIEAKAAAAKA